MASYCRRVGEDRERVADGEDPTPCRLGAGQSDAGAAGRAVVSRMVVLADGHGGVAQRPPGTVDEAPSRAEQQLDGFGQG